MSVCWVFNSLKLLAIKAVCLNLHSTAKGFHIHNLFWVVFSVDLGVFSGVFCWLVGLGFLFNQILPFYCCCHFQAECHSWYSPQRARTSSYAFKSSFGKWLITFFFGTKKFITVHRKFCKQLRVPPARGIWWIMSWVSTSSSHKGFSRAVLLGWGVFWSGINGNNFLQVLPR